MQCHAFVETLHATSLHTNTLIKTYFTPSLLCIYRRDGLQVFGDIVYTFCKLGLLHLKGGSLELESQYNYVPYTSDLLYVPKIALPHSFAIFSIFCKDPGLHGLISCAERSDQTRTSPLNPLSYQERGTGHIVI